MTVDAERGARDGSRHIKHSSTLYVYPPAYYDTVDSHHLVGAIFSILRVSEVGIKPKRFKCMSASYPLISLSCSPSLPGNRYGLYGPLTSDSAESGEDEETTVQE